MKSHIVGFASSFINKVNIQVWLNLQGISNMDIVRRKLGPIEYPKKRQ